MKVAHIVRRYARNEWGGTETVVSHTVEQQLSRGIDARVFFTSACQMPGSGEGYPYFYPYWPLSRANVLALDKKGGNPYSFGLFKAVEAFAPDVIHIHAGGRLACAAVKLADRLGVKSVMSLHGGAAAVPESELREMTRPIRGKLPCGAVLDRLFGLRFDVLSRVGGIIAISREEELRLAVKYGRNKVHYLPNGVAAAPAISRAAQWDRASVGKILCVSRIDYQKNQLALVDLLARMPEANLTLVGPVTAAWYAEEIQNRVEALGVGSRFRLVPGLPPGSGELEQEYAKAGVFVLPSVHEPFGIVALEAMERGLPLIAASVGGLVDFVKDGENGLLFDPSKPGDLERAYRRLLNEDGLAERLVEAGRRTVEEYTWPKIIDRLTSIYNATEAS